MRLFTVGLVGELAQVLIPVAVCMATYLGTYRLLRGREFAILLGRDHVG